MRMNETLLQRQADAQTRYDDLTTKIRNLNDQIQPLAEERLRVEGEHRVVTELLTSSNVTPATPEAPIEGEVVSPEATE